MSTDTITLPGVAIKSRGVERVEYEVEDAAMIERRKGASAMETQSERNPEENSGQAEVHIAGAQQILKALQEKIGEHPEIGAAITKLEMALNDLAVRTGGLL
jgi:hypothetical protein